MEKLSHETQPQRLSPLQEFAAYGQLALGLTVIATTLLIMGEGNGDNPEAQKIKDAANRTDDALKESSASGQDREAVREGHQAAERAARKRTMPPHE